MHTCLCTVDIYKAATLINSNHKGSHHAMQRRVTPCGSSQVVPGHPRSSQIVPGRPKMSQVVHMYVSSSFDYILNLLIAN